MTLNENQQAARDLRFSHEDFTTSNITRALQNWENFILEEELIRYCILEIWLSAEIIQKLIDNWRRTNTFIFLLDTAFTIFHKTPPRVTIPDLAFPFPYPDICFQAESGESFIDSIQQHFPNYTMTRRTNICQTVEVLCGSGNFGFDVDWLE